MIATAAATVALQATSPGEATGFWILAPIVVVLALGLVLSRKAVHSAIMLAGVMICLAVLYAVQNAPFLAMVQVIVYTGAIMMLFLFVLMLVGVDSSDSFIETLRGQRVAAVVLGIGFLAFVTVGIGHAVTSMTAQGLTEANASGNVQGLAALIFTKYVLPFEVTSALLITAALGAMVLTHRERTAARRTQREQSRQRFAGARPSPLPGPGVYATHNAVDTPALLPDGTVAPGSVSPVLEGISASRYPEVAGGLVPVERGIDRGEDG